uniref:CCHC-type domain-containing protein n=1 Tax=Trichogramma kaykai TaxID=54128 RepID=A0ABD2XS77_9HYME
MTIRPLSNQTKKILISNVASCITNQELTQQLKSLQVEPLSAITFVRSGSKTPGYEHVFCFRRHVYIKPGDVAKIPPRLDFKHDNEPYTVYFSSEKLTCFSCKEEGHIAKFCKNLVAPTQEEIDQHTETPEETSSSADIPESSRNSTSLGTAASPPSKSSPRLIKNTPVIPSTLSQKRQLASPSPTKLRPLSYDSSSSKKLAFSSPGQSADPAVKRVKQAEVYPTLEEIKKLIDPAVSHLKTNSDVYPIEVESLSEFLLQTYGTTNVYSTVKKFTSNTEALVKMLSDTKRLINCINLKARITRLIKKLSDLDAVDRQNGSLSEL